MCCKFIASCTCCSIIENLKKKYIYTKLRYESWTRLHFWLLLWSRFHRRMSAHQSVHHIQRCTGNIWRPLMNGWTRPTSAASTACTSSSPCSTYTSFTTSVIINKPTHYKINRLVHKHFGDSCLLWVYHRRVLVLSLSFVCILCIFVSAFLYLCICFLYLFVWYVLPLWRINVLITATKC